METGPRIAARYQMLKLENALAWAVAVPLPASTSPSADALGTATAHLGPLTPPPLRQAVAPQRTVLALPRPRARPAHRSRSGESVRSIPVRLPARYGRECARQTQQARAGGRENTRP